MSAGITPSLMTRASLYMSSRNRLSASMRWVSPASITRHSAADRTRGRQSTGMMRSRPSSSPYTVKDMPSLENERVTRSCMLASSSADSDSSVR